MDAIPACSICGDRLARQNGRCKRCDYRFRYNNDTDFAEKEKENKIDRYYEDVDKYRELGRKHVAMRKAQLQGRYHENFEFTEVFERDGWICGICGKAVEDSPVLDHIIPISRGGTHTRENTQCAHAACNCSKGSSLPSGWDE